MRTLIQNLHFSKRKTKFCIFKDLKKNMIMNRLFKLTLIAVMIQSMMQSEDQICNGYPDFRLMSRRTDYDLVRNRTYNEQFAVKGNS